MKLPGVLEVVTKFCREHALEMAAGIERPVPGGRLVGEMTWEPPKVGCSCCSSILALGRSLKDWIKGDREDKKSVGQLLGLLANMACS